MNSQQTAIQQHQQQISKCRLCPDMIPPVITCQPIVTKILLIGQAPGDKEGVLAKPFAWTAGKTLFKWFSSMGVDEEQFRQRVYMSAVCRCFPGKNPKGGDRVPSRLEISTCSQWLNEEISILQPELIIPVGKLAINQFIPLKKLTEVIGQQFIKTVSGSLRDIIPLPHPSGASTWHRMEPGITLLQKALNKIEEHKSWQVCFNSESC